MGDQSLRTYVSRMKLRGLGHQTRPSKWLDRLLLLQILDCVVDRSCSFVCSKSGPAVTTLVVNVVLKLVDHVLKLIHQALRVLPQHIMELEDFPVELRLSAHVLIHFLLVLAILICCPHCC